MCRAVMETQTQRLDLWTPGQGWDQWREKHGNIYTTIRKTDIGNLLYDSGNSNQGSVAT